MIIQDDRTDEEKSLYPIVVVGTDKCLSGWGKAEGGISYAGWACRDGDENQVESWVRQRGDMRRVRVVLGSYRPKGRGHYHVYVVRPDHPAVRRNYGIVERS